MAGIFGNFFRGKQRSQAGTQKAADQAAAIGPGNINGTIGQTSFAGSFGNYDAAKFHDASVGNAGQYSTPGGVGHAQHETTQRTPANMFHATPHGAMPAAMTAAMFNPFNMFNFPQGEALAAPAKGKFRMTVKHRPSRENLTGGV